MRRQQPDLHEAMRTILLGCENYTASLHIIAQENRRLDLYQCIDGSYPRPNQIGARARRYPGWFEKAGSGTIRLRPNERYPRM